MHKARLRCSVTLRPAPICQIYTVQVAYRHRVRPRVIVVDPVLKLHLGATSTRTLHLPGEWNDGMYLDQIFSNEDP